MIQEGQMKRRYGKCVECGHKTTGTCNDCGVPLHWLECSFRGFRCSDCINKLVDSEDREAEESLMRLEMEESDQ